MFMSQYNHTIDAKGRLIIPSKYRDVLGESFVVTKGLDGCLLVYGNEEWKAFEDKLQNLPLAQREARQFVRFFLAGACEVEVDKQGRILLPNVLREFAKLEKDVILVGAGKKVEIWSKDEYERATEDLDMDTISEHMAELGYGI